VRTPETVLELDIVHEPVADLERTIEVEGIEVESLTDLWASKLTCLLSRSEPRDLVDLLFLEKGGLLTEDGLPLALAKDSGIDPGVLAWLLKQFPVEPMPTMLEELEPGALLRFRNELSERLRRVALGGE
jgi:hypothetical protein